MSCGGGLACAFGECVPGDTLVQIDGLVSTYFVRTANGRVFAWGNNEHGKANPKSSEDLVLRPEELDLPEPSAEVRVGPLSTCSRAFSGGVWCWGSDEAIAGSTPADQVRGDFVRVPGVHATRLTASTHGYCVQDPQARGFCWGPNSHAELHTGSGLALPSGFEWPVPMLAIPPGAVTLFPALAALPGGPVLTWGDSALVGRDVDGTPGDQLFITPVPGLTDVTRVDAGRAAYCTSLKQGRVFCWGADIWPFDQPREPFEALTGGPYVRVTVGGLVCGLRPDRGIDCIRKPPELTSNAPAENVEAYTARDIVSGVASFCLIALDGVVYCRGSGSEGEQGNGSLEPVDVLSPVETPR